MHTPRTRLVRPFIAAALAGAAAVGLLACLEDFKVLPPGAADAASQVDSASPPVDGAAPPVDGAVDSPTDPDAGPKPTRCDGVVPPVGVNAGDFLCADFDSPMLGKAWDSVFRSDGGTIEKTSDVAVSQPNAMTTTARGSFSEGTMLWKKGGPQAFSQATAAFHINPSILGGVVPAADGLLELMRISTSNASVTFGFSRGSNDFGGAPYYGYFVNVSAFGGAAAIKRFTISTVQLDANVWTAVKLIWEAATGNVVVLYNNNKIFSETGFSSLDTVVSFRLGAFAAGDVGIMPAHRFDDVELSIRR